MYNMRGFQIKNLAYLVEDFIFSTKKIPTQ